MGVHAIPGPLWRFVEGHFDTFTAVDVLLHLRREHPRAWTSRALARRLRIDPDQTESILARLDANGLVRRQGHAFTYGPRSAQAAGAVDTLADIYARYRHRIIGIIFPPDTDHASTSHTAPTSGPDIPNPARTP